MAELSDVNLFERHVEKGVLGVCVLLLLVFVHRWGFSSPRRTEVPDGRRLGAKSVAPSEIDAAVLRAAQTLKKDWDDVVPETEPLDDHVKRLQWLQDNPLASLRLAHMEDFAQPGKGLKPGIDIKVLVIKLADLAKVIPPPPKPTGWAGLELPKTEEADKLEDVVASHVVTDYPAQALRDAWKVYLEKPGILSDMVVLAVQIKVQEKLPTGQWTPPRAFTTAPMKDEEGNPIVPPAIPMVTINDEEGNPILIPRITPFDGENMEEVTKDIEELKRLEPQTHICRPPHPPIYDATNGGWFGWQEKYLPAEPEEAEKASPGGAGRAKGAEEEEAEEQLPPVRIWFHDTSLKGAATYRYQLRLVLLNPLLTHQRFVKEDVNPEDARTVFVMSPWSEWSDEIPAPNATEFFLVGSTPPSGDRPGRMRVSVFAKSLGQTVRSSFTLTAGGSIGSMQYVKVVNPLSEKPEKRECDFSTGSVAVDFDFDRKVRKGPFVRKTVAMLYLDERGRLRTIVRVGGMSKESERRKLFNELTKDAKLTQALVEKTPVE